MSKNTTGQIIKKILADFPEITLGFLFGSAANEQLDFESDIDLAVAGKKPLNSKQKKSIIDKLAISFNRPIDLIDLSVTYGTLLHQILTKGELIYCTDRIIYAELIKKMLYNQADMMPYHDRILKERRERWING